MPKETREQRNLRLRTNAARLKAAGFTSKEADRFKAASEPAIQRAIAARQLPAIDPRAQQAGRASGAARGWKSLAPPNLFGVQTGRIQYTTVDHPGNYRFLAAYSYVLTYVTKTVDKDSTTWERKYITVQSDYKISKAEAIERAYDVLVSSVANKESYRDATIIRSSFELVKAVINPAYI